MDTYIVLSNKTNFALDQRLCMVSSFIFIISVLGQPEQLWGLNPFSQQIWDSFTASTLKSSMSSTHDA